MLPLLCKFCRCTNCQNYVLQFRGEALIKKKKKKKKKKMMMMMMLMMLMMLMMMMIIIIIIIIIMRSPLCTGHLMLL